jgi:hypothetical protein
MAASDPVPCYYTGQNYRWERPAEIHTRAEVRGFKKAKLGTFIENGKIFLFFKAIVNAVKTTWDGPLGRGLLIPFSKKRTTGDKLHYETAMAGDGNWIDGYTPRRRIYVSSRSLFSNQVLPAARIEARV